MVNIYFVRHGETEYNVLGLIQGRVDKCGLTENGKIEGKKLSSMLSKLDIEMIFSSPLKRAVETADIISRNINIPIEIDDSFIEMDCGAAEGCRVLDFNNTIFNPELLYVDYVDKSQINISNGKQLREYLFSYDKKYNNISYIGGEAKIEASNRMMDGILEITKNQKYENICIVSHSLSIMSFLINNHKSSENKNIDIKHDRIYNVQL